MRKVRGLVLLVVLAGCGEGGPDAGPAEWRAQVDTLGDTVVVRTVQGSEWETAELVPELRIGVLDGDEHEMLGGVTGLAVDVDGGIYLYDGQVPALRKFDPDGEYIGTLGGEGSGPGEYANSDGGLAVLSDGRVVLRDPGNGRFNVYDAEGEHLESWRTASGAYTATRLFRTTGGELLGHNFAEGTTGLVRYRDDGTPTDTLALPEPEVERATLSAESEDGDASQVWNVPFSPAARWSFHPEGYYLSAVSDRYAVDLLRPDREVLRIEREAEPVPVTGGERAAEEERVARAMRRLDPSWRWEGPSIPDVKPLIRSLHAGEDGRIWVQLHQPAEELEDPEAEPGPDGESPIPEFREPVVFDVFEADGRYLGRVEAPEGFQVGPAPVFRGEHVWGIQHDELDVQYVVRYRIEAG